MVKEPFAFVVYIERNDDDERLAFVYRDLDEAEEALRDYAKTIFVGGCLDDELVEALADKSIHVRIFACLIKRNKQISEELELFARETA